MIVSHAHKFIFVKTRKTAGTSLEIALSRYCGPHDIITPISPEDEETRRKRGCPGPQNHQLPWSRYQLEDWKELLVRRRRLHYYNHMPAARIARRIPQEVWSSFYKFTIERNPWDKALSLYYFQTRANPSPPPLGEYLRSAPRRELSNFHLYSIDGALAVDHVIQYDDLESELKSLAERLGLSGELDLPRAKGQYRKDRRSYREVLSEDDRTFIEEVCAREIAAFGYRF